MPIPQLPPSSPPSDHGSETSSLPEVLPSSSTVVTLGEVGHSTSQSYRGGNFLGLTSPEVPLASIAVSSRQPPVSSSSDPGIMPTSPIRGATKAERQRNRRRKGAIKSVLVRAKNKATQQAAAVAATQAAAASAQREQEERVQHTKEVFNNILQTLNRHQLTIGAFMEYIFDVDNELGTVRWTGFFQRTQHLHRILGFWVSSKNSPTARESVQRWMIAHVKALLNKEARDITRRKIFQTQGVEVNQSWILRYNLEQLHSTLQEHAPVTLELLHGFATTQRQDKQGSTLTHLRKAQSITSAVLSLLRGYSQKNNFAQHILSLYLYAAGAQRQVISVLSHLGLVSSYTSLTVKGQPSCVPVTAANHRVSCQQPPPATVNDSSSDASSSEADPEDSRPTVTKTQVSRGRRPGILPQLSLSCLQAARTVASTGLFAAAYDNINMVFKSAEPILGRKDTQENGTCSTIWPLWNARLEDILASDLEQSMAASPPLTIGDILLTDSESQAWNDRMIHTVLRIIVQHGSPAFERFRDDLQRSQPLTPSRIAVHKTPLHPLPAMDIDESSINGNVDVADNLDRILEVRPAASAVQRLVRLLAGDQLSLARLRTIMAIRAGHTTPAHSFANTVLLPGLFHGKMAATGGLLVTHWGKPHAGTRNPGSLAFHNTVLDRKPITITSLPPFRLCRDLIFVSLYARVLHCLLLVSDKTTLDEYTSSLPSWEVLRTHAHAIVTQFTPASHVSGLRALRKDDKAGGDMVLENAILFMRDGLTLREFTDAIKAGDSGRIITVLKIYALAFRASGRPKYAHEMLHLLHNLTHVWPPPLRSIVLNNWLVNPSGKSDGFIEVDLMQEHQNFWVKTVYQAHGSNASWDWLEMISPCVEVLRHLANQVNRDLGSVQGMKHQTADINNDITRLMDSLQDHGVYTLKPGRILDSDEDPAPDVISAGLTALLHGNQAPLHTFNAHIHQLQERRKYPPLGEPLPDSHARQNPPVPHLDVPHHEDQRPPSTSTPDGTPTTTPPIPSMEFDTEVNVADEGDDMEEEPFENAHEEVLGLESAADVALDMDNMGGEEGWGWVDE